MSVARKQIQSRIPDAGTGSLLGFEALHLRGGIGLKLSFEPIYQRLSTICCGRIVAYGGQTTPAPRGVPGGVVEHPQVQIS